MTERIRKTVEANPLRWQDKQIPITLSIGITKLHDDDDKNIETFFKRADEALYRAKKSGRNQTCIE